MLCLPRGIATIVQKHDMIHLTLNAAEAMPIGSIGIAEKQAYYPSLCNARCVQKGMKAEPFQDFRPMSEICDSELTGARVSKSSFDSQLGF